MRDDFTTTTTHDSDYTITLTRNAQGVWAHVSRGDDPIYMRLNRTTDDAITRAVGHLMRDHASLGNTTAPHVDVIDET